MLVKFSATMIDLPYSIVIEATEELDLFSFYSPELEGFTGVGHSVEDCIYNSRWGMKEHLEVMTEQGLDIPMRPNDPTITIRNQTAVKA